MFRRKAPSDGVYFGVASIPSRSGLLKNAIDSVYEQAAHIGVYLNNWEEVPDFLRRPKITIARSQELGDIRDNGKFHFLNQTQERFYASIDDDIVYPSDYVKRMATALNIVGPTSALGVHGVAFPSPVQSIVADRYVWNFNLSNPFILPVQLLGTGTAFFDQQRWGLRPEEFGTPGMADVWFARASANRAADLFVINRDRGWLKPQELDAPIGPIPPANLYREALARDDEQVRLLRELQIRGDMSEILAKIARRGSLTERFSISQAARLLEVAQQLDWDPPTEAAVEELRAVTKEIMRRANIPAPIVSDYLEVMSALLLAKASLDTLERVDRLKLALPSLPQEATPAGVRFDSRVDRLDNIRETTVRQNVDRILARKDPHPQETYDVLKPSLGARDTIDIARTGLRVDFFDQENFKMRVANRPAESAADLANLLATGQAANMPSDPSWWLELIAAAHYSTPFSLVAAIALMRTGHSSAATEVCREIAWRSGIDTDAFLLRAALLAGPSGADSNRGRVAFELATTIDRVWSEWFTSTAGVPRRQSAEARPDVAVIMTVRNGYSEVDSSVKNILESDEVNLRLVVVDDGSDDGTAKILSDIMDGRVTVIHNNRPIGPYLSRNLALQHVDADYVAIQDSGDYSLPLRLARQTQLLIENPHTWAVTTQHFRFGEDGLPVLENHGSFVGEAPATVVFRRSLVDKIGGFLPVWTRGDVEFLRRARAFAGSEAVRTIATPMYIAAAGSHSLRFTQRDISAFLGRANQWHKRIAVDQQAVAPWAKDGFVPFRIPAPLIPE